MKMNEEWAHEAAGERSDGRAPAGHQQYEKIILRIKSGATRFWIWKIYDDSMNMTELDKNIWELSWTQSTN